VSKKNIKVKYIWKTSSHNLSFFVQNLTIIESLRQCSSNLRR